MEYFDFDQAAHQNQSSLKTIDEPNCDSLLDLDNDSNSVAAVPFPSDLHASGDNELKGLFPMNRAAEPCFFCGTNGLDCFVAQRGVLQKNGCTCCIALYRECSFTHARPQGEFLNTLHVVGEDAYVPTGSLTGKKALRSYSGPSAGALIEEPEQRARKTGARFPKPAVRVLKSWLSDHITHPYPTDEEKDDLKAKTGLKRSQICNWLANARRRGKPRPAPRSSSPFVDPVPIPGKQLPPGVELADLNPLERWKHSPPEHEAASARDIIHAMAHHAQLEPENEQAPASRAPSHSKKTPSSHPDSSNARPAKSSSGYSLDTTQSSLSDMSFASAFSHRSSRASLGSMDRERRRRRHKSAVGPNPFQKSRAARIFQCTFCTDSFPTKYDWQRHEKSLHLALDKWTCAPHGGVMAENDKLMCAFCRQLNPDRDHLESHNFSTCQEKTIHERTFYRKDHLNQHLRLMHNVKLGQWMDQWKSTTTEIKSRCGFCSAVFTTWKDRVDHLAAHFKGGVEMSQWKGDWGFEAAVERCLESAIPPYLIAHDRNTLNPFVAPNASKRKSSSAGSSVSMPVPQDANCFQRLEVELSAYIGRLASQGITPTDAMLQSEARKVIYGCDDPWNQTCADNPTWLRILKRDAGLADSSETHNIGLQDLGMQPPFAANGGLRRPPRHTIKTTTPPLSTSAYNTPGLESPAFPGSGFHSAAASQRGSLSGSIAGSYDFTFGHSSGPTNIGSLPTPTSNIPFTSCSTPDITNIDPLVQMGFDAEFLQRLDDKYGDISHPLDEMHIDKFDPARAGGGVDHHPFNIAGSAPIQISQSMAVTSSAAPATGGSFDSGYQNMLEGYLQFSADAGLEDDINERRI